VVVDDKGMLMGLTAPVGERPAAAPPASRPSVAWRASPRVEVLPARELLVAANELLADQPRSAPDGRPALGVMLQDLDPALGLHLRLEAGRGVQVTRIAENGPARRAGIRVHDVIVRGNGVEFAGLGSFLEWFDARKRREEVTLEIYQAGRPRTIRVRLD
jgi:S1-C subfamily serine protease